MAEPTVVTVPASMLLEVREVAAASYAVARQVESATSELRRLTERITDLTKLVDNHHADEKPALESHAAYVRRVLAEQDEAAAEAGAARVRARAERDGGIADAWSAARKIIPWLLALLAGGGWFADRVATPPAQEAVHAPP